MSDINLKTCPFCGCDSIGTMYNSPGLKVWCHDCRASTSDFDDNVAIQKWNTRTVKISTATADQITINLG